MDFFVYVSFTLFLMSQIETGQHRDLPKLCTGETLSVTQSEYGTVRVGWYCSIDGNRRKVILVCYM